ncbi:MAG: glycerophosphodiester phosphodiesterase family protein [Pseudomonadales bacterium]
MPRLFLVLGLLASGMAAGEQDAFEQLPIVIAHRGASGQRPEHTLAAYQLALDQGADFVELDLVATRDGALIARHENALAVVALDSSGAIVRDQGGTPRIREATTDVAERGEFADRLTVKEIDGRRVGGWFSEDFTLSEIRSLKARERMPELRPSSQAYDDEYSIPTLAEAIALIDEVERHNGTRPGLYIEIKHPTYFLHDGRYLNGELIGIDLGESLLRGLEADGFVDPNRVFIQCFEVAPLIVLKDKMAQRGIELPLIQLCGDVFNRRYRATPHDISYRADHGSLAVYGDLNTLVDGGMRAGISYAELATPAVLSFMARRYAAGIGPHKQNIMLTRRSDTGAAEFTGEFGALLGYAHAAGLKVHPYTLRAETLFRVTLHTEDGDRLLSVVEEALMLLEHGVDGFFIDQPALGRVAVEAYVAGALE